MDGSPSPKISLSWVVAFTLYVSLFAFLPLLCAGVPDWLQGWIYAVLTLLSAIVSRLLVAYKHPDLLVERSRYVNVPEAKPWDKKLVLWVSLIGPLSYSIVCGLDKRFSWSPDFPTWLTLLALILTILAHMLSNWALVENPFFSLMARIQSERGQFVVDSGPYGMIRHPGYAGAGLIFLMIPVFLGSLWGLLPALATVVLLVYRTSLEDRMLQEELPGYREYAERTHYRLVPGVW